jgi:hypothetical protein
MSARRWEMPLMRLQWQAWGMIVVVLALAVATALLLIAERAQ